MSSRASFSALLALCALALGACIIEVEDTQKQMPGDPSTDAGENDAGPRDADGGPRDADGGGGIWEGDAGTTGFPGSGIDGDPGTGLLLAVRIDPGTANLAKPIEDAVDRLIAALEKARLRVTAAAVVDLATSREVLVWEPAPNAPKLADALRKAAASGSPTPSCTTAGLYSAGRTVLGSRYFGPHRSALIVGLIDSGGRASTSGCPSAALFAGSDPAAWIVFGDRYAIPRPRTRILAIATPETETQEQMRARCLALPGFPTGVIDGLAASPIPLLGRFIGEVNAFQFNLGHSIDLCESLSSKWDAAAGVIADQWAAVLKEQH